MVTWEDEKTDVTQTLARIKTDVPLRNKAYLVVLAGANVGEMYKLQTTSDTILGRGRSADLRILDDGVSRAHARIRTVEGSLVVDDLDSRNGTFCNGRRITSHSLVDGDKVQLGRTTILRFTYNDAIDESFHRQMYDSALRDGLTKAFNKRYFNDRLESELRFAHRHNTSLSLLLLDLDRFKLVNDRHGHLGGDHTLMTFAAAMQKSVRDEDVFARYGGEEFAVISRAIAGREAQAFAERLRIVAETLKIQHDGQYIPVTVSIGIASVPDVRVRTGDELLETADQALYWAKQNGRNRVAHYVPKDERTDPSNNLFGNRR